MSIRDIGPLQGADEGLHHQIVDRHTRSTRGKLNGERIAAPVQRGFVPCNAQISDTGVAEADEMLRDLRSGRVEVEVDCGYALAWPSPVEQHGGTGRREVIEEHPSRTHEN